MFWAHRVVEEIKKRFAAEIASGKPLIIRDEKTMSGRVHVGSLRGVVIHGVIDELLTQDGINHQYLFEINDFDVMDGLPVYLDQERFRPFMGQLLCEVPSPDDKAKNYAEYFASEFIEAIGLTGYAPSFYRSSDMYRQGKYNEVIRIALDHADEIRAIYKEVSGSVKDPDWLPLNVICQKCGRVGTTKAIKWDGSLVHYRCLPDQVSWAQGCSHEGETDPYDGRAKLPWKVEWPAKFRVFGVNIEGAGKDHATKGGTRDVARNIVTRVFKYPEPLDIPYNFFVVGGKKMSSSKGQGSTAKDIAELLPRPVLRFMLQKEPKREIDFEPYGDSIPVLFDQHDALAQGYFDGDEEPRSVYPLLYPPADKSRIERAFLPRLRELAYLVQMPHINIGDKVSEMKGQELNQADKAELECRILYARKWLDAYSPENFKFELQEREVPEAAMTLTDGQKSALRAILAYIEAEKTLDGSILHAKIHEIKKDSGISPQELFSAIYVSFLGKGSGPQAGWFLSALPRDFVIKRLREVSA